MPFSNYTQFRSNILSWLDLGASDVGATQLDDLIIVAENKINRQVRSREQETVLNVTMANGVIPVPTNYVQAKNFYVDGNPTKKLERANSDYIYAQYPTRAGGAKPRHFAREGSNFIFGPYPDSAYTVKGIYYQRLDPLATTLHALFTANEDLYLWAALSEAEAVIGRDPRIQIWEQKYQNIKNDINGEDFNEAASGGGLAIRNA